MAFLVGGANSAAADAAYDIDNSLRFNDDDSPKLERTVGTPTNEKIYTISIWCKKAGVGVSNYILGTPAEGDRLVLSDRIEFMTNGTADSYLRTNRLTRDISAFYHIVIAYDTTQGTAANRIKLYINGEQYTWDLSTTFPSEDNTNGKLNKSGETFQIGTGHSGAYGDGYFSEFNFVDGQALASSSFGETDGDSGIWKPKKYSGSYGDEGFFLEFKETGTDQDSSGIGADTSGNDNHFAVTNLAATDQTTDTPTNNFCTLNPLHFDSVSYIPTFSEGNCKIVSASGNYFGTFGTIAIPEDSGLWYWEAQSTTTVNGSSQEILVGVEDEAGTEDYNSFSGQSVNGDEICGYLIDRSGNTIKTYKADVLVDTSSILATGNIFVLTKCYGADADLLLNFGNPPHTISSGNADPNGYGNFEYATKSGYALCTKNLAEFG